MTIPCTLHFACAWLFVECLKMLSVIKHYYQRFLSIFKGPSPWASAARSKCISSIALTQSFFHATLCISRIQDLGLFAQIYVLCYRCHQRLLHLSWYMEILFQDLQWLKYIELLAIFINIYKASGFLGVSF